jgi:hypothetical protein
MASQNTLLPAAAQTPSSNTNAVATLAAPTDGSRWVVYGVNYSYSAAPTLATLVFSWTIGVTTYTETYYIIAGGSGSFSWPKGKVFPANTAVTITLLAGGSGISGTVYPVAQTELA